jgi:hypothetical protein
MALENLEDPSNDRLFALGELGMIKLGLIKPALPRRMLVNMGSVDRL